ncbi:hypothetical protein C7960_0302 [Methanohalophilus euhalobius]|jgi:hypothetical protein|uniref:AAA domain-containing protein n=1 Tax=Methanohalophilus euhalobius TaxID=51203 RepID=A0A285ENA0_9EURY|nr:MULTISPECIES: hypothetical protein [Methanohalophilus]ODV49430.1 MAG: putative cytoplasmic protein [Methanohalophilus sp. 2-GBenrich]RXG35178.1 putative cytoplasmic protein [Methanohalophilus sp. WG1-DM]TCL11189.1 hypothetical protein C7960_0302 [Methanohalophilus euhalobius]SNY00555.1 hypothetical protein SAMN06295989_101268 [Methanohalophilus euhalobius]
MEKLNVELENCYGIRELTHTFSFEGSKSNLIYAPNGTMKTSFAKTFLDTSRGISPKDGIFEERITTCRITDETGSEIDPKTIFVIESERSEYSSEKMPLLLANRQLRSKYEKTRKDITTSNAEVRKKLQKISGMRNGIEEEICETFGFSDILECYTTILPIINNDEQPLIDEGKYKSYYNPKIVAFLNDEKSKEQIDEYIKKYNELIESSGFLKKGIFNHTNATDVAKQLKSNKYFEANHKIVLDNSGNPIEVDDPKKFEEILNEEITRILKDKELQKRFEEIDQALTKNAELKAFREFLENKPSILPELKNLAEYRKKIWISYFKQISQEISNLVHLYEEGKKPIAEMIEQAKKENTEWKRVVEIFNSRFSVPYTLSVVNQEDVILQDEVPTIHFEYNDQIDKKRLPRSELVRSLSTGEKRALYILDIIFEVEARKIEGNDCLLVIDDLADSFDYKNKYAIIQYLDDIVKYDNFLAIILSHNFDFFRTIQSRLGIPRNSTYMVLIDNTKVELKPSEFLNPSKFIQKWQRQYHENPKVFVSLIPFVRNLIEYTKGVDDSDFLKLTSLLHYKADTESIRTSDILEIYNKIFNNTFTIQDDKVIDIILNQAEACLPVDESINLETKLILAIAIRLLTEKYIIKKINDQQFVNNITSNQTSTLIKKLKEINPNDENLAVIDGVNLMTPENIHFNSFMYEPLIDISSANLKDLYKDVKAL